jgi:hypothetical protein
MTIPATDLAEHKRLEELVRARRAGTPTAGLVTIAGISKTTVNVYSYISYNYSHS